MLVIFSCLVGAQAPKRRSALPAYLHCPTLAVLALVLVIRTLDRTGVKIHRRTRLIHCVAHWNISARVGINSTPIERMDHFVSKRADCHAIRLTTVWEESSLAIASNTATNSRVAGANCWIGIGPR